MSGLWDAAAVAKRLGRSRSWFYEHRAELERCGFPLPLPVVRRWNPPAVDAWVDAGGKMIGTGRTRRVRNRIDGAFA
jgi:predicted DNA-binding transcriptional regulator AlpA